MVKENKDERYNIIKNMGGITAWVNPYRLNLERWAYTLHRITGVVLVIYIYLHIYETGFRIGGREIWMDLMRALVNPFNDVFLFLVVASLLYHGLNGIRLILAELGFSIGKPSRPIYPYKPTSLGKIQKAIFISMMVIGIILLVIGFIEFFIWGGEL